MQGIGVSADHHLTNESQYWYLVELARYFWDNDPIYGTALTRIADNVIGCGFSIEPRSGIDAIDDFLEADWERYSQRPELSDSAGEHSLSHRAHSEFCATLNDGDVFNVPRSNGAIQSLESHRCRTSRGTRKDVLLGIEVNDQGERIRYWFTKTDSPLRYAPTIGEIEQVEARDNKGRKRVWHYYLPRRMSQRRGVSVIAPIAEYVQMHSDVQYAKLFQQQAASAYALIHELPMEAFVHMSPVQQEIVTETLADTASRPDYNLRAGIDYWSRFPGEKVSGFSANIPNPEYFKHVLLILQIISINIGIPVQVLLLDASMTNFSGWRGSMDEARRGFERLQKTWGVPWYRDKYEWRVRYLASTSREFQQLLTANGFRPGMLYESILRHDIHPPRWRYIEPVNDITARAAEVGMHFLSPQQDAANWGQNFWSVTDQTIDANDYGIRKAAEAYRQFKQEFPEEESFSARDWWAPATPTNVRFNISTSRTESDQAGADSSTSTQEQEQPA